MVSYTFLAFQRLQELILISRKIEYCIMHLIMSQKNSRYVCFSPFIHLFIYFFGIRLYTQIYTLSPYSPQRRPTSRLKNRCFYKYVSCVHLCRPTI